jgi:hypothetical protein
MDNVLDFIYNEILRRVKASSIYSESNPNKVRPGNIAEYSTADRTKRLLSLADYPALQIIWGAFTPDSANSNSDNYKCAVELELPTGTLVYKRYNDLALGLIEVCNSFKGLNRRVGNARIYGATIGAVSPITYSPNRGEGQVECWTCQTSIEFNVAIERNRALWEMNIQNES